MDNIQRLIKNVCVPSFTMQWGILYEPERNNSDYALKVNIAFYDPTSAFSVITN